MKESLGAPHNACYHRLTQHRVICVMRCSAFAWIAVAILAAISPAAGFSQDDGVLLSRSDYAYLATQGVQADSLVLQGMSPKELSELHWIINDKRTRTNSMSKTDAVKDALAEFKDHQQWEKMNPGHLWGEKQQESPGRSVPN